MDKELTERIDANYRAIAALTDQVAQLVRERDELQKQVWLYEKNGVTCQTYRHTVKQSCSECNVQMDYNTTPPQPEQEPVAYTGNSIVSPASVLEMVRNAFGLNVSDLADVFQTTRQTVYQWMKLSAMEQVRSHVHLERIKVLYRATQFWNEQPKLKGRWSKALLPTGVTVLDILKANQIDFDTLKAAHAALSGGLAQPEQEPVAWRTFDGEGNYDFREYEANESYRDEYIKRNGTKYASWVGPLYTTPPKREWQSLTDDEIKEIIGSYSGPIKGYTRQLFDKIEAKLKEKNHANGNT